MKDEKKPNITKQRYEAEGHPVEEPQTETKNDKYKRIANKAVGAAAVAGGIISAGTSSIPFDASGRFSVLEKSGLAKPGTSRILKAYGVGLIASGAVSAYLGARALRRKD